MIHAGVHRVAIVGAGPAGLYAAAHLLENCDTEVNVDLFERLPTPWGLVRAGVAPDHPEKKLIIDRQFDFYLKSPRVRFFGNVEIGLDITHAELTGLYDAVIYSVGADSDVRMGIPGETLPGSWAAREFVAFYNGHPDYGDLPFNFATGRAVVVGNGNVALDVARILTTDVTALARTDISDRALALLRGSAIQEVVILARRGPRHAAYNNPELEEFAHVKDVDISVEGIDTAELGREAAACETAQSRRKVETLRQLAGRPRRRGVRRIVFKFFRSPMSLTGVRRVEGVTMACNELAFDSAGKTGVRRTGRMEMLQTGLVLRAVGYRGAAFPGLPFDEQKGVIRNVGGRVADAGGIVPGVYTTGWIKRGCNGIIGSNKKCAQETTDHLLQDLQSSMPPPRRALQEGDIERLLSERKPDAVLLHNWSAIDRVERDAGRTAGRPRVKLTSRVDLLEAARPERR